MIKVLSVFGTRPEAIKMAPVVKALEQAPQVQSLVAVTAQHREMLDQVLDLFHIQPQYDLNLMHHGQTLSDITSGALRGLLEVMEQERPNLVLVHGDTTTTFAGALAAFYAKVACGHVEAGLRTGDKYAPYPEEMNRCLTGQLADYHFAPTQTAKNNLLAAGVKPERIVVTGNTVIDALLATVKQDCDLAKVGLGQVDWNKKVILLTCHRRENWGKPMTAIFRAVARLAKERDVQVVFPVHKNPVVRQAAQQELGGRDNIFLVEPLDYLPMAKVMNQCYFVMTDSGGLQEEAPALGKPVLVLREVTERPEAVQAGTARLAGTREDTVYQEGKRLLTDPHLYVQMARAANPYGDGTASQQIVAAILGWLQG